MVGHSLVERQGCSRVLALLLVDLGSVVEHFLGAGATSHTSTHRSEMATNDLPADDPSLSCLDELSEKTSGEGK